MHETFGRLLTRARAGRGLLARDLAKAVGVGEATFSLWANDRRIPDVDQLRALCRVLHVSADVLLGRVAFQLGPVPEGAAAEHAPHCIYVTQGAGCTCGRV